jgi:ABC-type lipoprotein release transport system permease subunit
MILELKRMALRNLARRRLKTILTVLAVTVSVALYIFVDCWLKGMNLDSVRNIVQYETGAAKLQTTAYFAEQDDLPMYENFSDGERYMEALQRAGYDSAPRFVFTGTLFSTALSVPVIFYGVDPAKDSRLLRYANYIDTGRYIKDGAFEIVLGAMTADKLGIGIPQRPLPDDFNNSILPSIAEADRDFVKSCYVQSTEVGRYVLKNNLAKADLDRLWKVFDDTGVNNVQISTVIDIKDGNGKVRHVNQLISVVVTGTVNSPDPKTNNNAAYIPLSVLQDDAGMMLEGALTEILIRKQNPDDAALPGKDESPEAITAALNAELSTTHYPLLTTHSALAVYDWKGYVKDYIAASAGDDISTRIMTIILFILSFLGIANTMLLSILERTKEIGMMRAQGMSDGELIFMMMMEAGMIGAIGSALGVIIGCLVNIRMVKYGIDYTQMMDATGGNMGYRINGIFRSTWYIPVIIGAPVVATILSACMAFIPTRRALKMPVIECLRFE